MTSNSNDPVAAFEEARTRIQNCGKNCTRLELSGLALTTLPPEIGQLTALTHLDLDSNQLTTLPDGLRELRQLAVLGLHDNPALEISLSVLGPDRRRQFAPPASAKSILDFYFSRPAISARPLNEIKLFLVGRGGAGKTSTIRALRGLAFQPAEPSTAGISLCDWTMSGCQGAPVTAHVWDFAGQVITTPCTSSSSASGACMSSSSPDATTTNARTPSTGCG